MSFCSNNSLCFYRELLSPGGVDIAGNSSSGAFDDGVEGDTRLTSLRRDAREATRFLSVAVRKLLHTFVEGGDADALKEIIGIAACPRCKGKPDERLDLRAPARSSGSSRGGRGVSTRGRGYRGRGGQNGPAH